MQVIPQYTSPLTLNSEVGLIPTLPPVEFRELQNSLALTGYSPPMFSIVNAAALGGGVDAGTPSVITSNLSKNILALD
jgi:hypothetical protein